MNIRFDQTSKKRKELSIEELALKLTQVKHTANDAPSHLTPEHAQEVMRAAKEAQLRNPEFVNEDLSQYVPTPKFASPEETAAAMKIDAVSQQDTSDRRQEKVMSDYEQWKINQAKEDAEREKAMKRDYADMAEVQS